MNMFTGKELGPDDWSGKKTVKTGQQGRSFTTVTTTTSCSVGTENALPSSSDPGFLSSTRKHSSSSRAASCSDASSDDNSTTVVNEGRFLEPIMVSDSEEGDTEAGLDDYSIDGYGGCLDCNDIIIDDSPDDIDSVAIDYWRRVKANRKRSLTRERFTLSLENIDQVTEENDNTQIEVVHDVKQKAKPPPPNEEMNPEPTNSKKFMRMVKSFKNQRFSKHDHPSSDVDEIPEEEAVVSPESFEVETQLSSKKKLSKLVKMLSNSKLLGQDSKEGAIEHSCASSTENPWDKYGDKYKTPDGSISSEPPCESEEGTGEGSNEEESSESSEEDSHSEDESESEGSETEEPKDAVDAILEETVIQEDPIRPSNDLRKSIWHKSVTTGASAAARAMRSRASLVRIDKSMKFNPEDFSDASGGSNGDREVQDNKRSFLRKVSKSARLSHLGKSMKRGVANIRKLGKKKSISEPNLVVCIDGKGDRLPSKKRSTNVNPDESDTKSDTSPSQDHESHSGESYDTRDDVVVEVDGPVVLELCLPVMGVKGYEDENNSTCSSTQSGGRTVNTDWYLARADTEAKDARERDVAEGSSNRSVGGLSLLGIEAPLLVTPDGFAEGDSDCDSAASGMNSDDSDSSSESSQGDLNTLSEASEDDSILYEIFPANSFSSLTGIKCNGGCTKMSSSKEDMVRTAQVMVRGRSRVRSHGRHSNRIRTGTGVGSMLDGGKGNKQRCQEEEDSIIECIAEDSVSVVSVKSVASS